MPERAAIAAQKVEADQRGYVAALGVRVDDLGDNVRGFRAELHEIRATMASANDLRGLSAKIDSLGSALARKSETPWTTIASFASLVFVIGYAWISSQTGPLKDNMERADREANAVRREVLTEIKEVRALIVPRGEHEQRWANASAVTANLQRQIDDNSKAFGSTYSLRDAIGEISKRIDKLEMVYSGQAHYPVPSPALPR